MLIDTDSFGAHAKQPCGVSIQPCCVTDNWQWVAVSALVAFANLVVPVFLMDAEYDEVWWDDLLDSYAPTQEQAYAIHLSHNGMPNERLVGTPFMIVSETIARLSDQTRFVQ
jgi:hypothetical protein